MLLYLVIEHTKQVICFSIFDYDMWYYILKTLIWSDIN